MANSVLVIGQSGTGKSTSIEHLDHKETFVIKVKNKPLPFRGCNKKYIMATGDRPDGNMWVLKKADPKDRYIEIKKLLNKINTNRDDIKTVIVDDLQYLMVDEYMARCQEKGFDKFAQMAQNFWSLLDSMSLYRSDLNIIFLCHNDVNENGLSTIQCLGKMLRGTVKPEGMFTVMLHTFVHDNKYKFLTQYRQIGGNELQAKSPRGMFDEEFIDNDLKFVIEKMNAYYNEEFEDIDM